MTQLLIFKRKVNKFALEESSVVHKQNRSQRTFSIVRCFPDFVCRLKMHLLHGILGVCRILISVKPGTGFHGRGTAHDL